MSERMRVTAYWNAQRTPSVNLQVLGMEFAGCRKEIEQKEMFLLLEQIYLFFSKKLTKTRSLRIVYGFQLTPW